MAQDYLRQGDEPEDAYVGRLLEFLRLRDLRISELEAMFGPPGDASSREVAAHVEPLGSGGSADGLEEAEALLAQKSQAEQSPGVAQLLESLQAASVYTDTPNHETNRKLWDAYAKNWSTDQAWVQKMASHLPEGRELGHIGDEWSDEPSLQAVLETWLFPYLRSEDTFSAAEVGSGGGRVATKVVTNVGQLVCFDVSGEMLKGAKTALAAHSNKVRFQQVDGDKNYPAEFDQGFDFVYCFDVCVHMDLHQMRRTLASIRKLLKPGARCFLSFANLLAPDGWRRFARQQKYTVGGFYFVSPEIVRCLLARGGLELCEMSSPQAGNTYLNRDLLVIARRPLDELAAVSTPAV